MDSEAKSRKRTPRIPKLTRWHKGGGGRIGNKGGGGTGGEGKNFQKKERVILICYNICGKGSSSSIAKK